MEPDKPRKSRLRHLRLLLYLVPILAIVIGYGGVILATGESYPFTIVLGHSMTPTILPGSVALIDKVPFNSLQVGDIIVFVPQIAQRSRATTLQPTRSTARAPIPCFVIHRIVGIVDYPNGTRIITTKGDDNGESIPLIDIDVNSSMYIGKVVLQTSGSGICHDLSNQRDYCGDNTHCTRSRAFV